MDATNQPPLPTDQAPLIWLIIGDKLGDNAQAIRIADSLGLPYQIKRLRPLPAYEIGKPRFRPTLEHLDPARSDRLAAPWPDLVITIGRRHSMAALWVKQQSPSTRLVLIGRARRWLERFDLVITLPQYSLPELANVLRLSLPLMRADQEAIERAAEHWRGRLQALPRPLIVVLVGGPTRPFRFDAAATRELLHCCNRLQAQLGGTLYFSTSRRTPPATVASLRDQLPAGARLFQWQAGAGDNPYQAFLRLADYFVVTGDSVSMMLEVADCGKPLAIFPLPIPWHSRLWGAITRRLHAPADSPLGNRLYRCLGRWLYRSGVVGFSRDLARIHESLIAGGYAVRCGETFAPPPPQGLADDLLCARERIIALLSRRPDSGDG